MTNNWMVRAGRGAQYIEEFEKHSCVAVGWEELGDLSGFRDRAALQILHDERYAERSKRQRAILFSQISRFVLEMKAGDGVVAYNPGTREYLIGEIDGPYQYLPERIPDLPNVRPVRWHGKVNRDELSEKTRYALGGVSTLYSLSDPAWLELKSRLEGEEPETGEDEVVDGDSLKAELAEQAHEFIKDVVRKLEWDELQELVAGILRAMGYKTLVSSPGPDLGKDIVASPDGLGLENPRIRVEVKHRKGSMGAPDIRSFIGALRSGDKGLYVSSGGFTKEANYEAERANVPVTLVDLDTLVTLLTEHYEALDAETRVLVPLRRLYWPVNS